MSENKSTWTERIALLQDKKEYHELNWEGSFEDYLELVRGNPRVTRTAFQRVYDMILSHGKSEYIDNKKKLVRYHFFQDERFGGRDAIYGLDVPLMKLVNVFKSAALGYGNDYLAQQASQTLIEAAQQLSELAADRVLAARVVAL